MFARLSAIAALAAFVVATPTPQTPADSKVGGDCTVTWTPDTTGLWNSSYIELMAGSNYPMQHITTLASGVDMTSTTNTTFTFTCPNVTPNSDIYFLQFTSLYVPATGGTTWTTRFLIAGADGSSTPPAQATQPDGKPIGWGNGTLGDAAAAVPAPTDVGASAAGASTPAAGASASAGASGASAPAGVSTPAAGGASASGPSASAPAGASKSGPAATGTNKVAAAPSGSNSGSAPAPSGSAPASGSGAARTGVASLAAVGAFALAAAALL